ncbi:hypothetical protein NC653_022016 [Populus alba x Populus x berolinensis]|uniref:Uncharacterized protein n=1 Tax=Populus alba x Populus x berolinensis TaxID=444605 RepID=A0AAD6QFB1_9ROSI|nr:hypothetical protein NC653_022010 [Populus alba x Populus x berolinensis]KAJ6989306.1 hypothetical protein NC653_022016 [Populus alba x Populus x berolinensis]
MKTNKGRQGRWRRRQTVAFPFSIKTRWEDVIIHSLIVAINCYLASSASECPYQNSINCKKTQQLRLQLSINSIKTQQLQLTIS